MYCTGTTLELLPTEMPAHPAAPEEPKLPEPGVSNPAVVREVMGWGFSKEEAVAKAAEIQNGKQQEEEIKECDVKVSEIKECDVKFLEEAVSESEECESTNEEAEPARESALEHRPAVLESFPPISPKQQVEKMKEAGGRGRGRGKGKGRGRGAKAKRKHSSDDSGEESSSEDEEVEEEKVVKSSKNTEKAVAKKRARSKKAEKTEENEAEGEADDGNRKKTKGKGLGDKKPEPEDGKKKKKRGKKAEGDENPQTEDGKKKTKTRGKTTEGEKKPETEEGKHEEKTDGKKAKGEENRESKDGRKLRKARGKKAAVNGGEEDHEEKAADEKKNEHVTDRKNKRAAESGSTRPKKSKGQATKDPENAKNEKAEKKTRKRKNDDSENETEEQKLEKERKAERSRKSSAYCAARKKALEDGLSEAEAKEKGREVLVGIVLLLLWSENIDIQPRIVLLGYLILAKHCYMVVEQPAGSLLKKHRRYVNKDGVQKFTGTSGLKQSASRCYPEGFAERLLKCWEGRAPALASSTGKFVAGNRPRRLASVETLPHSSMRSFESSSVDEMQVESRWRVEEHEERKARKSLPMEIPDTLPPSSEGKAPATGQDVLEREVPVEVPESTGEHPESMDVPMGASDGKGSMVEKPGVDDVGNDEDGISLGYSPGSTRRTSEHSKTSGTKNAVKKFDKYYHKKLGEKLKDLLQKHGNFKEVEDPDGSLMDSHLVPDDEFPLAGPASGESEQAVKEAAAVAASSGSTKGMAEQISRLVKQLEEKYKELSNKEADYLAASDSRQNIKASPAASVKGSSGKDKDKSEKHKSAKERDSDTSSGDLAEALFQHTEQGVGEDKAEMNFYVAAVGCKGFETPDCIRPDLMHCFNIGIGGDLAASGLMAACRMSIFGEGTFAPYHETAFEVQRFALQQNWRLVSERLGDSRKHRPAWALFLQQRLAAVSIRGTHVEQSRGGDLFTDFDAELKEIYGAKVHSGVLLAALALERELRPTLKRLGQAGYRIILTGHSLGGGVAAVLLWLLRHGTCGERLEAEVQGIGYAVPSVVDHRTSEALRPCFTSVVNSMDAVPRLSSSTLSRLADELSQCAEQSKEDQGPGGTRWLVAVINSGRARSMDQRAWR
eukprot:s1087_g4.t1